MTNTNAIITKTFNDTAVLAFRNDGWFNMTKAANAFGKDLSKFMQSPQTIEHLEGLSKYYSDKEFFVTERDSAQHTSAETWAHPKLAVLFGYWLGIKFGVWCELAIDDILKAHRAQKVVNKGSLPVVVAAMTPQWATEMLGQIQEMTAELQTINEMLAGLTKRTCVDVGDNAYMTVDEYLDYVGIHHVSDADKKRMEEAADAYCQDFNVNY